MRNLLRSALPLTRRFARHANSEHEQGIVRIAIALLICAFVIWQSERNAALPGLLATVGFFLMLSIALLAHIAWQPQPLPTRRIIAILNDVGGVTYAMFYAGELGVPIYLFYLWITFGNGFRFGKLYLYVALLASLSGFSVVLLTVDYWHKHLPLAAGLWGGMIMVGLYFSTLVARLTAALQLEEAANQAKRSFISSVSHELRTPLNAIIGMANLLHSTALSREQADMVRSLDNASHLMLTLIEDVLDFSKIEAGKLLIEEVEFDLHHLVNSTLDIFTYQASARGLELLVQIDPTAPWALHGDPHHLRQVLVNLMSNAVKFTERGRIVLRIACTAELDDCARLLFEVEDTGIGIAAAAQEKVFDSFTQADDSTSRRYGGTGLGTTISRQLVELMGGKLRLRSEVGVGSTFWFELDLRRRTVAPQVAPPDCCVLLIGFDLVDIAEIETVLASVDVGWRCAPNLVAALTLLATAAREGRKFDLALLAPGLSGTASDPAGSKLAYLRQLVLQLHQAPDSTKMPVMATLATVEPRQSRQQLAEMAGLANVLPLPFKATVLLNALHALGGLDQHAAPQQPSKARLPVEGRQYRILVAEDNPTNRIVIHKMLERAGHTCTLVEDGEQALDQIEQQPFDAVILDMNMPVMNGLEASRAIRLLTPPDHHLPILMLSADVSAQTIAECKDAGIDQFLPKPIQIDSLLAALDRLIGLHGVATVHTIRKPGKAPILLQPVGDAVMLNYATLAELDALGQDPRFVDGLLQAFVTDTKQLMSRLEQAWMAQHYEQTKDLLHAIKGSAMSIGAVSLRVACDVLERRSEVEFHDADALPQLVALQGIFRN